MILIFRVEQLDLHERCSLRTDTQEAEESQERFANKRKVFLTKPGAWCSLTFHWKVFSETFFGCWWSHRSSVIRFGRWCAESSWDDLVHTGPGSLHQNFESKTFECKLLDQTLAIRVWSDWWVKFKLCMCHAAKWLYSPVTHESHVMPHI